MLPDVAAAAANNARWCDAAIRSYGIPTRWGPGWWAARDRTPFIFPAAVTIRPGVPADELLSAMPRRRAAAVKDSFSDLDLEPEGFRPLFTSQWIAAPPADAAASPVEAAAWRRVPDPEDLADWQQTWGPDTPELFRPELLTDPTVTIVAEPDGAWIRRGAILNRSGRVVGVSNVFDTAGVTEETWRAVLAAAARFAPGRPVVGYESGDDLTAALAAGCRRIGELRVWVAR
ncbi:hypothetical protein LX16_5312 [Stackebrandtia albiflava]|uniref:GNAT acetyltransferase-like protein n=1 Tax=Stackebrandtia albiflava TaxID=406432 RepID=A0A562UL59_9ACTN|nr:hypothetical protein [Stackebrandtia albiflava]TWJ06348.1 hypothetical protein LX16_5312 [Stackebrandtia albiflava]